jgi:WD40 repeat protein
VRSGHDHAVARTAAAALAAMLLAAACTSGGGEPQAGAGTAAPPAIASPGGSPPPAQPVAVLRAHRAAVTHLAWSPDGKLLASSAGWFRTGDTAIRLWRPDGTPAAVLRGHTCGVMALAWSPDGRTLASASCDERVILWRRDGTSTLLIHPGHGAVLGLGWAPDGRTLATASVAGTSDNVIDLWRMPAGTLRATLRTRFSGGKFLNVGWSSDGRFVAGGAIDYHEWRADGTPVFSTGGCEHCTPAWGFAWSPDGAMWGTGTESGDVHVYRTDGTEVARGSNPGGNVDVMAWSPDGGVLAAANTLWTIQSGEFHQVGSFGAGRMTALAWAPDGSAVAGGRLHVPEVSVIGPDGRPLRSLPAGSEVSSLAWSPDGAILASGSRDRAVRLWAMSSS